MPSAFAGFCRRPARKGRHGVFARFRLAACGLAVLALLMLPATAYAVIGTGQITGKVTAPGGTGIAGVEVNAYTLIDSDWSWVGDATTDEFGDYAVAGLPTGTFRVDFYDNSGLYLPECYNNAATLDAGADIGVTDGATTSGKDVELAPAGHIAGKVTAPGGAGIEGVRIDAYSFVDGGWEQFRDTYADEFGDYDLGGLPTGTYRLRFTDWSGAYLGECYDNVATVEDAQDISVTAGSTTPDKNAALALAGHIAGKVTNPSGTGLQNIRVAAYRAGADDWFDVVSTDVNGNYNVGGLPTGTYRLEFLDYSGAYLDEFFDNAGSLGSATGIAVTAGSTTGGKNASLALAGHIAGKVSKQGGTGIAGISVYAYKLVGGEWNEVRGAETNGSGDYNIGGLATGTYRLEFWDDSGTYLGEYYDNATTVETAADVSVTAGTTTWSKNATLALPGHITGRVTDPGGVGILDVDARAYRLVAGEWEEWMSDSTDSNGDYDVTGLPTGTYRLEFRDYQGRYLGEYYNDVASIDAATNVPVTAGATTSGKDAVLALAGHITGKVTDSSGAGIEGMSVIVYSSNGDGWEYFDESNTDALGDYDAGSLPTGAYRIWFRDSEGVYAGEYWNDVATLDAATSVAVTAGETVTGRDATLALSGHITGKVTNSAGAGIEGISVSVFEVSGGGQTESWIDISTDSLGNYDASGLPTGTYKVRFDDWRTGKYVGEYYNDASEFDAATTVGVTAGSITPNIDVSLADASRYRNVYRFRNLENGFYLWSADENEKATIIETLSDTWDYEGVAYKINTASPDNRAPIWRFLNLQGGFYLYSADPSERDTIVSTLKDEWRLEGPSYSVSHVRTGRPVWRFRNKLDGTYLLSADPSEKDTIVNTLSETWQLEGPSFYIAP